MKKKIQHAYSFAYGTMRYVSDAKNESVGFMLRITWY